MEDIDITTASYDAGGGKEFFIAAEDPVRDALIAYIRVRIPSSKAHRMEVKEEPTALIRELHVYGSVVPVNEHEPDAWQHRGYGGILLREAEQVAHENGAEQILVTSALGVRDYFRRQGYERMGPYMGKILSA